MAHGSRTKPIDRRRADVLGAAAALMLQKGLAETSISEIAALAGIGKGSFYLYFDSKDAIVKTLRRVFVQQIIETVEARVRRLPAGEWDGRLKAWVLGAIEACLRPETLALNEALFHGKAALSLAEDQAAHRPAMKSLEDLLRDGAHAGAWQAGNARRTAVFLYSAFHGALDDAIANGEHAPRPLGKAMLLLFRRALAVAAA